MPTLATKATLSALDKFERKISGKGFTLFISNEWYFQTSDIIKIVESIEKSGLLFEVATETVKHETKKQGGRFLGVMMALMVASLLVPMASSLIKPVSFH